MQVKLTKIYDIGTLFKADFFYRILVYSGLSFTVYILWQIVFSPIITTF